MIVTCIITWPDGSSVTARTKSTYANEDVVVQWAGAKDKLVDPPERTDGCAIEAYMENAADDTGGVLTTDHDGEWTISGEVK